VRRTPPIHRLRCLLVSPRASAVRLRRLWQWRGTPGVLKLKTMATLGSRQEFTKLQGLLTTAVDEYLQVRHHACLGTHSDTTSRPFARDGADRVCAPCHRCGVRVRRIETWCVIASSAATFCGPHRAATAA